MLPEKTNKHWNSIQRAKNFGLLKSSAMKLLIVLLLLIVSRDVFCQAAITIFNRSSWDIDSIIVVGNEPVNFGRLEQKSEKRFFVNMHQANFHSFAPFYFKIFANGVVFPRQWQKSGFTDTFYFYNKGINVIDAPLVRPSTFRLSVLNAGSRNLDTIIDYNNSIREITEISPRRRVVIFDQLKLDSNRNILFNFNDTTLSADLSFHEFNNWADSVNSIYIENDSVFIGPRLNKTPLEYIVDLYIEGIPIESVGVQSNDVVRTYDLMKYFTVKRLVFKYEDLILKHSFRIKVGRKTHLVKLSENDLKLEGKYYFVSKDKIW